jgi:hypothetical protein
MGTRLLITVILLAGLGSCARLPVGVPARPAVQAEGYRALDQRFAADVQPVLKTYCYSCHSGPSPASMLDLTSYDVTAKVVAGFATWEHVHSRLERRDMPPARAAQPTEEERRRVVAWITAVREHEAERNAGDPGLVLARRLSNAEFDYTVQDLTGIDVKPARAFPVDPATEAGFDNSGETLAVSPALLTKYLDAARNLAEHVVFTPQGFNFAPHVVVTDPDRDRYVVNRIMAFYQRQPTDLADYFLALWRYENRSALGLGGASLASIAAKAGVAPQYLELVRGVVQDRAGAFGPIAGLHARWDAMPAAATRPGEAAVRAASEKVRDYVVAYRRKLAWTFDVPRAAPLQIVSQPLVMHVNRQGAAHHRILNPKVLIPAESANPAAKNYDPDLVIPAEGAARVTAMAALERFCDVFPAAFLVSERTSTWLAKNQTGRLLSAGFHSAMGYFRDDRPLYDLILDDNGRRELDDLWRELDFITNAPARQLAGFVWYERTDSDFMLSSEFNHLRAEDQELSSEAKFAELRRLYEAKVAASGVPPDVRAMVTLYFDELGRAIRWTEQARLAAESRHRESLVAFAARAYRRPLEPAETQDLLVFYSRLRKDGLTHEDAMRDAVASIFVSPQFLYRVDLARAAAPVRSGSQLVAPLTDFSVADRLSYFLWSSMPDSELLEHAARGDLRQRDVLITQVRRMLRDERSARLAVEFGTNWLGVRRFEEFNSVDRDRFPAFTNDLRRSFFEEPVRFLRALIREDRPVLDLLYGDYTFVNGPLAAHYGMPLPDGSADRWVRVEHASRYQRGGLLPMAVFLTQSSPGQRTSPVKRGYWLARNVLGQHIPAPPPNVPALPPNEADLGALTLAQTLARHRSDPNCASCHATFDFFGLASEGYGPVGERRTRDLGGRPVDSRTRFPDGTERSGVSGVLEYIRKEREADFLDNLSRRLLSYALGRGVVPSDAALIKKMRTDLTSHGYRFSSLIEVIATSPQFLNKRLPADSGTAPSPHTVASK